MDSCSGAYIPKYEYFQVVSRNKVGVIWDLVSGGFPIAGLLATYISAYPYLSRYIIVIGCLLGC